MPRWKARSRQSTPTVGAGGPVRSWAAARGSSAVPRAPPRSTRMPMAIADGPVIVGGGPSGLAAAIELCRLGVGPVAGVERESEPGGIPRHSNPPGCGLRDLRTILTGPRYAERYRELATDAGVEVITETMVTGWE